MKNIIPYNFSASDMSSVGFYIFQTVLSFLLIFGIEPIQGQITNSFIVALITICLAYPFLFIFSFDFQKIKKSIKSKRDLFALFLIGIFTISVLAFSSLFLYAKTESFWIFLLTFIQIAIFIRKDIYETKGKHFTRLFLFLFIGVLFGWGIFNIIRFTQFFGINFPIGNPVIGIWGLIFYLFNAIWIIDKGNKITNYLYQKRVYLWILAGIMFLFIILIGGNK